MLNCKVLVLVLSAFFSFTTNADYLSWNQIEKRFQAAHLNTKALSHVRCFFEKYEHTAFQKKNSYNADGDRCSRNPVITLDSTRVFALIDYMAPSNERRMFLVDRKTGEISQMAVAHGRYKANMINMKLSKNKNSIRYARYFSNELNSNAPSSGFFVSGMEYSGKFGRSMVLHGLEEGVNDNACERAVVIHKHPMVTKSNAYLLSSGCPMISKSHLDHVINLLKGDDDMNGSVVFIYGIREEKWQASTCEGSFNI